MTKLGKEHRPPWGVVRWIDVGGLADLGVIEALARKDHLQPLAAEDEDHGRDQSGRETDSVMDGTAGRYPACTPAK